VRREIFLFDDFLRLRDFLDASASTETDALLGVGFFSTDPLEGGHGVGITVAPPFLEDALRTRVSEGHAAPYSREVLLFGDDSVFREAQAAHLNRMGSTYLEKSYGRTLMTGVGVSRWLLAGVHPGVFQSTVSTSGSSRAASEVWPREIAEACTLAEALDALLRGILEKVLGLRPASLVFLLESGLLARYFRALAAWKKSSVGDSRWGEYLQLDPISQEEALGKLVLTWLAEEGLHPRVAVVCRTPREHETLLLHLHWTLVNSPSCANVLFRL